MDADSAVRERADCAVLTTDSAVPGGQGGRLPRQAQGRDQGHGGLSRCHVTVCHVTAAVTSCPRP
eukprot:3811857-Rhodomonas_salina.3